MNKGVDISRGSTYLLVNKHSQESFYPRKKKLGSTSLLVISTGECFFRGMNIYGDTGLSLVTFFSKSFSGIYF